MTEGGVTSAQQLGLLVVGALLGFGLDSFRRWGERRRETKSIRAALIAEAETVVSLIASAGYVQMLNEHICHCETVTEGSTVGGLLIHLTENYLIVFEANCGKLGMLRPNEVAAFTRFHLLTKMLIDSFKPGSPWSSGQHDPAELKRALQHDLDAFRELDQTLAEIKEFACR